jgi:hypothetical protein
MGAAHRMPINRKNSLLHGIVSIVAAATAACAESAPPSASPTGPTAAVRLATVQAVTITPPIATLSVGQTQQYDLHVVLGEGTPPSLGVPYWSSSEPGVVTIEPDGRAIARAAGTAILTASVHGGRGTLEVRVSR